MIYDDFDEFYAKYVVPVYRYCFLRLGSKETAEDITQVVFEKVWKNRDNYTERGRPALAFLFTVARNSIIDHLRRNVPIPLDPQSVAFTTIPDEENDPRTPSQQREAIEQVYENLQKLDPQSREIVTMRYLSELDYEDIAKVTGKKEATIRQVVSRSLKALRENIYKND